MKKRLLPLRRRDGFTLMELMITLFIMAVLASLVTQGLPFLKEKTRDRTRIYELSNLKRVIELYKSDNNAYPASLSGLAYNNFFTTNDAFAAGYSPAQITPNYVPGVVPTYYEALPVDPLPGASADPTCQALGYQKNIAYFSNGDHYKLVYNCASERGIVPSDSFADPARCLMGYCWAWAVSDDWDYSTTQGW